MNGAENLLKTLTAAGVEVCFANPGTSEMHLVSAIGNSGAMRPILCLFEGVVSGAADGYGRMADKPARVGPRMTVAVAYPRDRQLQSTRWPVSVLVPAQR